MSFAIQFMYNRDPLNKINKTPESKFSLTGTLKDQCDITNPVILIDRSSPLDANYAYIPTFLRYYYITDMVQVRTNLWEIHMHCDVLKTFSEGILGSPCIAAKSSSRFNLYLNDENYKCQQNSIVMTKTFPQGFNTANACYILSLLGDKTTTR